MSGRRKDLIFLTGFMASGKSTLGPILANTLGYSFIDLDREIEKAVGKSVSEIFSEQGEEFFREQESLLLTAACTMHDCIVALGGGTVAREENIRAVKAAGILIYLRSDSEHILRRLLNKRNRPMITGPDGNTLPEDELRRKIATLLQAREPFYSRADITVSTDGQRVGMTVDELVRRIRRY